jgi:hypothetical protein
MKQNITEVHEEMIGEKKKKQQRNEEWYDDE